MVDLAQRRIDAAILEKLNTLLHDQTAIHLRMTQMANELVDLSNTTIATASTPAA